MEKKKILCIIGHSGAGKTYFEKLLSRVYPNHFHRIVSYTTRPMREDEQDGNEHWFVAPDKRPSSSQMLAYTQYGGYEYWGDKASLVDGKINTYVIDVEGYRYLRHFFADEFDVRVAYVRRSVRTGIDLQRQQRDRGRMSLNADDIDCIVRNEGSKVDLYNMVQNYLGLHIVRLFNLNS